MAALDSLPTEILLKIVSPLSIQDLAALSLQCHHLKRVVNLASPPEYRRFRFYTVKHVFKFLYTILEKPRLGTFVREIVSKSNSCSTGHHIPPIEKQPLLRSAIMKAGFDGEQAEALMGSLMVGRPKTVMLNSSSDIREALATLLLAICPNIEILRVEYIDGQYFEQLFKMAKTPSKQRNYLQNLRQLDLLRQTGSYVDPDGSYSSFDVAANLRLIAHLPSIESFTVRGVWICEDAVPCWLPPGSSNIKKLNLCYSQFTDDHLRYLIRHPKALEEFTFSSGQLIEPIQDERKKNKAKLLGKKLLCHKSTLKVLDLDVDNYLEYYKYYHYCTGSEAEEEDWESDDPRVVEPRFSWEEPDTRLYGETIGSLHDFTALKRLSIGVKALLGGPSRSDDEDWDQESEKERVPIRLIRDLPPNLEYLCIRGYVPGEDPGYTSQMEEFMANKTKWPPSLKEVHGITECVSGLPILDEDFYGDELPWEETESDWSEDLESSSEDDSEEGDDLEEEDDSEVENN
ncbi:hypothetical protein EMCG_02264 [[Emmonsia] crescens]|uniref:F-box domain-containing protein n=1 Tax=[Emmonsia] crescens TaxID=73230 RepID=A0A0G2HZD4_9EURO|nr:hypothetical protein EMCG_02264 [Emmonsia crescens UAMH 3008]